MTSNDLAAVVLAAGAGTRLRPLTRLRPKPLCPVAGVALVDHGIARVRPVAAGVAVNVHHHRAAMEAHLAGAGVHVSVEEHEALGTAGALGHLRSWLDGRDVVVTNGDAWMDGFDAARFAEGWDRSRIRLLVTRDEDRADFPDDRRYAGVCLLPWPDVERLEPVPTGLFELVWRDALAAGRVEMVDLDGVFYDCGTPRDYLAANLAATGGAASIGEGATVAGTVERSVVWPGAVVYEAERLVDGIKATELVTVLVR